MEKYSTLTNIDTSKELLAGSSLVWLHSFYFSHHPVTEFAHLYKNISKKNFFDVKCIIHLNIQSYTIYTFYGPFFQEECDQLLPAVLFLFSEYHFLCKQFIFQPNFEMVVLKTTFEIYW